MNTRKENRGASEPDLQFLQEVLVFNESDREDIRGYLLRNPEAIEPLQWLVNAWGVKNTRVDWFGEGWDEFSEGYPGGLSPFWADYYPNTGWPSPERERVFQEFKARFPQYKKHMGVLR